MRFQILCVSTKENSLRSAMAAAAPVSVPPEREFFIDSLLVRILFIILMIWWAGLALWEFEFPFPGSRTSTFLVWPVALWNPSQIRRGVIVVSYFQGSERRFVGASKALRASVGLTDCSIVDIKRFVVQIRQL